MFRMLNKKIILLLTKKLSLVYCNRLPLSTNCLHSTTISSNVTYEFRVKDRAYTSKGKFVLVLN
jgi:hypothetical protein